MRVAYAPGIEQWVADRIPGCDRGFGECKALGVWRDDDLIAALVYHNWCPEWGTIEVSAAGSGHWMTRGTITELLEYPFSFCQMVIAQHARKSRARRIWQQLGATEHVIPRLRGRDDDGYLATLTDDAWEQSRFNLKGSHYGQAKGSSAT